MKEIELQMGPKLEFRWHPDMYPPYTPTPEELAEYRDRSKVWVKQIDEEIANDVLAELAGRGLGGGADLVVAPAPGPHDAGGVG